MDLDQGAVDGNCLQLNAHYLFSLQGFEDPVEDPVFGPTIHASVDGVPVAKPRR